MAVYFVEKLADGILVLDVRGQITLGEETGALREKVKQIIAAGHLRMIIDLAEVTYIDSAGLATLVWVFTTTRKQGGDVKLLRLTRRVRDLLQITRLSTVFEVFDTLEAARQSLATPPAPAPTL